MEGDQGGRLAAHFCINLQIDSIRRGETGEGGRQAAEDDKAPGAGHSTLSKLFRLRLLDEWSALWACIPFARMRFGFTGAYKALYLTPSLSPYSAFTDMHEDGQSSANTTWKKTTKIWNQHITVTVRYSLQKSLNSQQPYWWIFRATQCANRNPKKPACQWVSVSISFGMTRSMKKSWHMSKQTQKVRNKSHKSKLINWQD